MDTFHKYVKKQLLEYVENERKRGIPLDQIEMVLLNAGHDKNIIDEVFSELQKEEAGLQPQKHKDPVENDLIAQLREGFSKFMAQASQKDINAAKKDLKKTDTQEVVEDVIEAAEVIEEKTMFETLTFFIYLVIVGFVILFTAGATDSNVTPVFIGFLPALINAFVSFIAIKLADNVPVYVFIPVIITSAFYGIGRFAGLPVFQGVDVESLAVVNFIFGFTFNILMVYVRFLKPRSMHRRVIKPAKGKAHVYSDKRVNELREEFGL